MLITAYRAITSYLKECMLGVWSDTVWKIVWYKRQFFPIDKEMLIILRIKVNIFTQN